MSVIEIFKRLDELLFLLINHDSDYRHLDRAMLILRNPLSWIPLYIFMTWFFFSKFEKKAWSLLLLSLINVAVTDSLASLLKSVFGRIRPCYDAQIGGMVRHLVDCGGTYSFPSSHAANHFGLATFWFLAMLQLTGKKWKWLWIWAIAISYAQIYVGKHYPSDVVAGALLGIVVGNVMAKIFNQLQHSKYKMPKFLFPAREKRLHG